MLRSLGVRNFRLYFAAQLGSEIGTWFQTLALSLLVLDLTDSGLALSLVPALQFGPILLLGSFTGTASDRTGPLPLVAAANAAAGLAALGLGVAAVSGPPSLTWIYGVALALGVTQAIERPTAQVLLFELVGSSDVQNAIALHSVTRSSGRLIGPALGGMAYAMFGPAACFFVNGASYALVVIALLAVRTREMHARPRSERHPGAFRAALAHVWKQPELRAWLLVNAAIGALALNFMTTLTAMVRFTFGGGADAVGWAHSANAVGAIVGGLVAGLALAPGRRHVLLSCAAFGAANMVNAVAPSLRFFLLWAPVFGFAISYYQTSLMGAIQRHTDEAMLGRVMSVAAMGSTGLMPIGHLVMGALIDLYSARLALGVSSTVVLACAAWLALDGHTARRKAPDGHAGRPKAR